ncbi:hypothetical protein [Photorhabdus stackebrandtii]|uniref:Hydroxymethyltransferase n=1 Tax=Photorhabdus stackebrandtii TaxID=1123042 RepID=A0A7X5QQD2_9GAMM|nr:hypothetical protein [Photorhabdus stackebrandtii]NHB98399.1 hypothetical protein [Photorhabdus stackebrandtii]
MSILYNAVVDPGATPYYGSITVNNLHYDTGYQIHIDSYLSFNFLSPASILPTDINPLFSEWQEKDITTQNVSIDANTFSVTVTIAFSNSYVFIDSNSITIGVNGDLTTDPNKYLDSFVFAADSAPEINGTVNITCAASPDPALDNLQPTVLFTTAGGYSVSVNVVMDITQSESILAGDYSLSAPDLQNADLTVIAPVLVTPTTIEVITGETTEASVNFGQVEYYCSINFTVDNILGLENEILNVTVLDAINGDIISNFATKVNETVQLRKLNSSGVVNIIIDTVNLNNQIYAFDVLPVILQNELIDVKYTANLVTIDNIDTTDFPELTVTIETNDMLQSGLSVRLSSEEMDYEQQIQIISGSSTWPVAVKPGTYAVDASNFIVSKTIYVVSVPGSITISPGDQNVLNIKIEKSANLAVKGFPDFLAFGGCADLTPTNLDDFVAARASSVFKYAGIDGAGDPTRFLTDDTAVKQTINLARSIEQTLNDGQPVLPVMISYTCNLSGGDVKSALADADAHTHSYANFILALNIANTYIDSTHDTPAGFIVNPDFIGGCQQDGLSADYIMPVRQPLQNALDHWSISAQIPDYITDDIQGYVQSVNWLVHTIAPNVVFGWQINLWGTGRSEWIYEGGDPIQIAGEVVNYVNSLGVFAENNSSNFLAIDRYEADDLTQRSYNNVYCYGPFEWGVYFDFCSAISAQLKQPVMPWQIPASRTPLTSDSVNVDFDSQHWGTSANYLLGDAELGSDIDAINSIILNFDFPPQMAAKVGVTPRDLYDCAPFDLTQPAYLDFALRGIFAVLLGGGSTTGIVSTIGNSDSWVRDKLNAYRDDPVTFNDTLE